MDSIKNRSEAPYDPSVPYLALDLDFNHVEVLTETSDWDLEFRQLSAGRLRGRARIVTGTHCTAMRVDLDRVFHQGGCVPSSQVAFGLPYARSGDFSWCNDTVGAQQLLNFNQWDGWGGTTGESFSGCTLTFQRAMLEQLAEDLELHIDFEDLRRRGGSLLKASAETARLLTRFESAFETAVESDPGRMAPFTSFFEFGAAESILRLLARPSGSFRDGATAARQRALRQALEILEVPENLPITVAQLCRRVGVSAPSLYRAFTEAFGVGPKHYIRSRVLSAVRSELYAAPPGTQINDIANAWGLWHMGQFAADYRALFGELPSETLRSRGG